MADIELRKRLAAACGMAINDEILDAIYRRLMNIEKGSIPLTLRFVFSTDKDGNLSVAFSSKCSLTLDDFSMALRSDGKQLTLDMGSAIVQSAPPAPPPVRIVAPDPPSFDDVSPPPPRGAAQDAASPRVAARVAALRQQAQDLYDAGMITKDQARKAGVEFPD